MKEIRILFLITDLGKGGAERFLVDHCSELSKYGHIKFMIGVLYESNQYVDETKNFNVVYLNFQTFSFIRKNDNEAYKKLMDDFRPHIVHSNRYLAEFLSSYYLDRNVVYVCHGHDNMIEFKNLSLSTFMEKKIMLNFLEKIYLWWTKYRIVPTYFIANSSHTLSYYHNVLTNTQQKNIFRIDYGFKFSKFHVLEHKQNPTKRKIKILNVGSFQHKKNQNFIVDIALELLKITQEFEIHLIGDGDYFQYVKSRILSEKLEDFIIMHGIRNDVQEWYKASDIYLHTAYYEPFGLVFLEAMAAGLPIVCLDGKGNRDIIEHGKNGFIFEDQNPKLFADTIISLQRNSNIYQAVSEYGKEFSKRFDLENQTKKFIEFYHNILEKK